MNNYERGLIVGWELDDTPDARACIEFGGLIWMSRDKSLEVT